MMFFIFPVIYMIIGDIDDISVSLVLAGILGLIGMLISLKI